MRSILGIGKLWPVIGILVSQYFPLGTLAISLAYLFVGLSKHANKIALWLLIADCLLIGLCVLEYFGNLTHQTIGQIVVVHGTHP